MGADGVFAALAQLKVGGADAQIHLFPRIGRKAGFQVLRRLKAEVPRVQDQAPVFLAHRAGKQVDLRRAQESRHKLVGRVAIQLVRGALLHDFPVLEQHDVVGHGHGFGLVMGYVNGGDAQLQLDFLELVAHLVP